MATTTNGVCSAQHRLTLFPAPLHIRKKSRRLSRLRFSQRKPTCGYVFPAQGPLDDIIDEIAGDIWHSTPCDDLGWPGLFEFPWTVTPLPLSRVPSQQPLAVRKTRHSNSNTRSTASSSTFSDAMASSWSRDSTRRDHRGSESSEHARGTSECPFPAFSTATASAPQSLDSASPFDFQETAPGTTFSAAEHELSTILESSENSFKSGRPPLRKRFFSLTNSMDKLRIKTSDWVRKEPTSNSTSTPISQPSSSMPVTPKELEFGKATHADGVRAEDVAAWMAKNGRRYVQLVHTCNGVEHLSNDLKLRASMVGAVCSQAAKAYPSPLELQQELPSINDTIAQTASPSVLTASVKLKPEVRMLSPEEDQIFWVAVEVEGVQHNRRPLLDKGIDVVFLIDNAYHVTPDSLNRALDLVMGSMHEFKKRDRIGLYTTHCTHEAVTGTVPDMWYPLSAVDNVAIETIREMTSDIRNLGTQNWRWPRPNPSMDEVVTAIAKSLECRDPRQRRTHVLVLSPVPATLHKVSSCYPSLHVHHISPAILPLYKGQDDDQLVCVEPCCENVTVSNMAQYQPTSERVRQIIRYARSEKPIGSICNVQIDLRRRPGCEVLRYEGSRDTPHLHLGQVHTFFAQIRVQRSLTQEMDLDSMDPIRDSSLAANNMRQDLMNAKAVGASKVHLLSVQLMHQSSILPPSQWTFVETPLLMIKDLGRLSIPTDRAMELYKRRFFYTLSRLDLKSTPEVIDELEAVVRPDLQKSAKKVLDNMAKELDSHRHIMVYDETSRRNLPSCAGPVAEPYAHDFIVAKWDARKKKRMGGIAN